VDPAYGDEALGWWQESIPGYLESFKYSLQTSLRYELFAFLLGNDERFTAPTEDELFGFKTQDAREWLTPYINSSYLEFSIIGDFNEDATIGIILDTIGALPQRADAPAEITNEQRFIEVPTAPQSKSFTYESKIPKAGAYMVWETPSLVDRNIEKARRFNVLSEVFSDRMRVKIREEMGGAYSPYASYFSSNNYDYGFFVAVAEGSPEEVDVFLDIMLAIASNVSNGDISQDEFDRAVLPLQNGVNATLRDNWYWLYSVMDGSQVYPDQLDWAREQVEFYEAITVDEINSMAIEYLSPDAALKLSIYPVNGTDTGDE
jgi:zinc protease